MINQSIAILASDTFIKKKGLQTLWAILLLLLNISIFEGWKGYILPLLLENFLVLGTHMEFHF